MCALKYILRKILSHSVLTGWVCQQTEILWGCTESRVSPPHLVGRQQPSEALLPVCTCLRISTIKKKKESLKGLCLSCRWEWTTYKPQSPPPHPLSCAYLHPCTSLGRCPCIHPPQWGDYRSPMLGNEWQRSLRYVGAPSSPSHQLPSQAQARASCPGQEGPPPAPTASPSLEIGVHISGISNSVWVLVLLFLFKEISPNSSFCPPVFWKIFNCFSQFDFSKFF